MLSYYAVLYVFVSKISIANVKCLLLFVHIIPPLITHEKYR